MNKWIFPVILLSIVIAIPILIYIYTFLPLAPLNVPCSTHSDCNNIPECPTTSDHCYCYKGWCYTCKPLGDYCSEDYQCCNNNCISNVCSSETTADIRAESFVSAPSSGTAGDTIYVRVRFRNYGNMAGSIKVEAGVICDRWAREWGWPVSIKPLSVGSTAQCCPGNFFVQDKTVTIEGGGTQDVDFNLVLPTETTTDACGYNSGYNWDNSFTLYAVTFKNCWSPGCVDCGATSYIIKDFTITTVPTTTTPTCNMNGICEPHLGETVANCPDCQVACDYDFIWEPGEGLNCFDTIFDFIVIPAFVVIIIVVIIVVRKKR